MFFLVVGKLEAEVRVVATVHRRLINMSGQAVSDPRLRDRELGDTWMHRGQRAEEQSAHTPDSLLTSGNNYLCFLFVGTS